MGRCRMILEGTNSLKGAIWPFDLDHPVIAVAERNVEEGICRRVGHLGSLVESCLARSAKRVPKKREGDFKRGLHGGQRRIA